MTDHRVVYADGDARVVCSCGETFITTTPLVLALPGASSGLAQWGRHQAVRAAPEDEGLAMPWLAELDESVGGMIDTYEGDYR